MTDLSNMTLAELEHLRASNERALAAYKASSNHREAENKEIDAEIERRKAEPDWEAWEPKWQAFRKVMGWGKWWDSVQGERDYIRALIAAHNTPLAGEWIEWEHGMGVPEGVSLETHEIAVFHDSTQEWVNLTTKPTWEGDRYRCRPRQS